MRNIQKILLLQLICLLTTYNCRRLDPTRIIYAIDCGSPKGFHSVGYDYLADQDFSEGIMADYTNNEDLMNQGVKYTFEPNIYYTERQSQVNFRYDIPVSSPGLYVLILKMAELWFDAPEKRKFSVKFGEKRVIEKLDIFAKVGKWAAYDQYLEFELKDKEIYFDNEICVGAYNFRTQTLNLEFERVDDYDLPKIDGIVLFEGELSETDYEPIEARMEEWNRRNANEERLKELEQRRIEDTEPEWPQEPKFEEKVEEGRGVLGLILTAPGMALIGIVAILLILVTRLGGGEKSTILTVDKKPKPKKY